MVASHIATCKHGWKITAETSHSTTPAPASSHSCARWRDKTCPQSVVRHGPMQIYAGNIYHFSEESDLCCVLHNYLWISLVYDSLTQISIDSSETRVAPRYGLQVQADSSWPRRCIAGARRREEPLLCRHGFCRCRHELANFYFMYQWMSYS